MCVVLRQEWDLLLACLPATPLQQLHCRIYLIPYVDLFDTKHKSTCLSQQKCKAFLLLELLQARWMLQTCLLACSRESVL